MLVYGEGAAEIQESEMTGMEDTMDVLLLCGYFEPKYQEEISKKTKTWVENAANTFQQRLIAGLRTQDVHLEVVSAPDRKSVV